MHTIAGTTLPRTVYLDSLHRDFTRLRALVWDATVPVPSCPGWTTRDLADHLAHVYWHQSFVVRTGSKPHGGEHLPDFEFDDAPRRYLDASFSAITFALNPMLPASREVWTFDPADSHVDFWFRRMAHETMVHRFDAELAQGELTSFEPALALDGVDEILSWTPLIPLWRQHGEVPAVGTVSLSAHTPERSAHYRLHLGPTGCSIESAPAADHHAAVVVDGSAEDVNLFLWGRLPASNPRILVAGSAVEPFLDAIKALGR